MPASPRTDSALLIAVLDGVYRQPCARRVARRLEKIQGVLAVSIHLPTRSAFIEYDPALTGPAAFQAAIKEAGYGTLASTDRHSADPGLALLAVNRELARYRYRTAASILLWGAFVFAGALQFSVYSAWLLATVLVFWCGAHFHRGALRAVKTLSPDINLLVSFSSLLIYAQGTAAMATRYLSLERDYSVYWPELAALIALTNLGQLLERQAASSHAKTLYDLLSAFPRLARRMVNGREEVCDAEQVSPGQTLSVRAGEQIPADAVVLEGPSTVDESLITGSQRPARKLPGDKVWGGTHNKTGTLLLRSGSTAASMFFAQSIAQVWRAQSRRRTPRSAADTATLILLPALFILAVFFSYPAYAAEPRWLDGLLAALEKAAALLAAGTPATLSLAAPLVFLFTHDRAEREGMRLHNPSAIEGSEKTDSLSVEQTGTLTMGKFSLTEVVPMGGDEAALLRHAMIALQDTGLPHLPALAAAAKSRKIECPKPDSTAVLPGRGAVARYGTQTVRAGTLKWLMEEGVSADASLDDRCSLLLGVSAGSTLLGLLRFADAKRPGTKEAVDAAKKSGIEPTIISENSEGYVTAAALDLDIKRRAAEVLPENRAEAVLALRREGLHPAVMGQGLYGAYAMACGETGISSSVSGPLDAVYSDIALAEPDFSAALKALLLLRRARTALRRNLLIAVAFGAALILPSAGLLPWKIRPESLSVIYLAANLLAVAVLAAHSYTLRRVRI